MINLSTSASGCLPFPAPIYTATMLLVTLSFGSAGLHANCRTWSELDRKNPNLIIGKVQIYNGDIFHTEEQEENHWIHQTANKLHIQTRKNVIGGQLLFSPGSVYSERSLRETERLLRAHPFIRDVSIRPFRVCGKTVDIAVSTTDNWTLTPSASFGRAGGVNTYSFKLRENNLLGLGKSISIDSKKNVDRNQNILTYHDSNLFGGRKQLEFQYQDNSDGLLYQLSTELPFYELNSKKAWSLDSLYFEKEVPLYESGKIVDSLGEKGMNLGLDYGWSRGLINDSVIRFRVGWNYIDKEFSHTQSHPDTMLPNDVIYSYPLIGWEYFQERFIEQSNLLQMGAVEDLSLGHHFRASLGWSNPLWGATNKSLPFSAGYSRGFQPSRKNLGLISMDAKGFIRKGEIHDSDLNLQADWFIFQGRRSSLHFLGSIEIGAQLSAERQIALGGDSGLRGYPLKMQTGDRKFLFTAEQRFFFDWYPLRLIKTGIAIFADAGSAWNSDGGQQNTLRDVGFGLRLVSTRQSHNKVLHIDFAFPLDEKDSVDGFQILIGAKTRF